MHEVQKFGDENLIPGFYILQPKFSEVTSSATTEATRQRLMTRLMKVPELSGPRVGSPTRFCP